MIFTNNNFPLLKNFLVKFSLKSGSSKKTITGRIVSGDDKNVIIDCSSVANAMRVMIQLDNIKTMKLVGYFYMPGRLYLCKETEEDAAHFHVSKLPRIYWHYNFSGDEKNYDKFNFSKCRANFNHINSINVFTYPTSADAIFPYNIADDANFITRINSYSIIWEWILNNKISIDSYQSIDDVIAGSSLPVVSERILYQGYFKGSQTFIFRCLYDSKNNIYNLDISTKYNANVIPTNRPLDSVIDTTTVIPVGCMYNNETIFFVNNEIILERKKFKIKQILFSKDTGAPSIFVSDEDNIRCVLGIHKRKNAVAFVPEIPSKMLVNEEEEDESRCHPIKIVKSQNGYSRRRIHKSICIDIAEHVTVELDPNEAFGLHLNPYSTVSFTNSIDPTISKTYNIAMESGSRLTLKLDKETFNIQTMTIGTNYSLMAIGYGNMNITIKCYSNANVSIEFVEE